MAESAKNPLSGLPSELEDAVPEMHRRLSHWESLDDHGLADVESDIKFTWFEFMLMADKVPGTNPTHRDIDARANALRVRAIEVHTVRRVLAANASKGGESKSRKLEALRSQVRSLWDDWRQGRTIHKSGAAFHRFVVDNVPGVTSEKTVERWARKWSQEKGV